MKDEQIKIDNITFSYPETDQNIFQNYSLSLPKGIVTFVGQNGTGKSTLLLLAAGLLIPTKGKICINGIDTINFKSERDRQQFVSFVYQNMEFETEENIGDLLYYVYENGFYEKKDGNFVQDLINVFELGMILKNKTQNISKGELQRTILAFSFLYGSKIIMMDEPIFAMEDHQKNNALEFIKHYCYQNNISVYYSLHDLDLSKKYSDFTLLFYKNKPPMLGPTCMMLERDNIEEAYQVPYMMLKTKEKRFRDELIKNYINDK